MADENNIGASRLLGTNNLQQSVDSLASQVNRLAADISHLNTGMANMTGSYNRSTGSGSSNMGMAWNASSNRSTYSSNGGGGQFTGGAMFGSGRTNGGGGSFGGAGRLSAGLAVTAGVLGGLTSYANKNMSTNMQMDFYGIQSAVAGGFTGGPQGPSQTARALAFNNNYAALNATDAAKAAYINQYTFGNSQFNGQANPSFVSGMRQANAFGYASPTLGAAAAATAAQQTFSGRAAMVAPALGLASPYLGNGVKNSMGNIANSILQRTFGNQQVSAKQFNASIQQGGSLAVNLQYFGQALGWNQQTVQEYQNYLQGQNAWVNKGGTTAQYDKLTQQAAAGNKNAVNQLAKTTGMGASMFENQRNLNATKLTRQNDILDSLAPAFDNATKVVNQFSSAITSFLKTTHLDQAIGSGAGFTAPFANALGGFSSAFGLAGGVSVASRLFGASGGGTGGLGGLGRLFGMGGAGGLTSGAGGAGTSASLLSRLGLPGLAAAGGLTTAYLGWHADDKLNANSSKFDIYRKAIGQTLTSPGNLLNPIGQLASEARWGKKGLQKLTSIFGGGNATVTGGGGGSTKATGTNSGANAAEVIQFAEQHLGDPYVWGGTGPNGWDCSGLIQWAYGKAGVKLPRVAADMQKQGKAVPTDAVQPGDLLFNGNPAHHVVMAIGGGKIIEAPHTGANVRIRSFSPGEFTDAKRILGSVGDMSSLTNGGAGQNTNTLNQQQANSGGDIGGGYGGTSELAAIMSALSSGNVSAGAMPLTASSNSAASTSGNQSPTGSVSGTGSNKASALQSYAKKLLAKYGWSGQWGAFNALEMSEAGWNPKATNPQSGAYGLAQALPAGKYASAGSDWKTSGETQLRWMMGYIKDRYGDPSKAWSFHQRNNWYDKGAWSIDKDQPATVHKGEMIIPAQQAETIRQTLLNNTFNPNLTKTGSGAGISIGDVIVQLPQGYTGTKQEAQNVGQTILDTLNDQIRLKRLQAGQ